MRNQNASNLKKSKCNDCKKEFFLFLSLFSEMQLMKVEKHSGGKEIEQRCLKEYIKT